MTRSTQRDVAIFASVVEARSIDSTRHKCFVSYHVDDADEVIEFLDKFGTEFIPRTVGVTDDDPFIDSDNDDYIKDRISAEHMADSTVTILFVGKCTWARQFVDWEIAATLRNSPKNKRSGLLAYRLQSADVGVKAPQRLLDNYEKDAASYAYYYVYPSSKVGVRRAIEEAFQARTTKSELVNNKRVLRRNNSPC